jgi:hypothetical protein
LFCRGQNSIEKKDFNSFLKGELEILIAIENVNFIALEAFVLAFDKRINKKFINENIKS